MNNIGSKKNKKPLVDGTKPISLDKKTSEIHFLKKSLFYPDFSLKSLLSGQRSGIFSNPQEPRLNQALKKPIFVVGSPRSGTTLLGSCLIAHSQLTGADESLFLIFLWRMFADLHQGSNRRKWAPLAEYISTPQIINSIGNFADSIFCALDPSGEKRYVDHTPWYVAFIPFINLLYPDSIFIHIIRNPKDVVNSLTASFKKGFNWAGETLEDRAILWKELVQEGIKSGRKLPGKRYLEVNYESLCMKPEAILKEIFQFLELPWNNDCLNPLTIAHAYPARENATIGYLDEQNKFCINKNYFPSALNYRWNEKEIADFERITSSLQKMIGSYS